MIKSIIQIFLVFFVLTSGLVIYYWRDIQYDPSSIDLTLYLGILPLLLCLLLFSPYFIYILVEYHQQRKQEQQNRANALAQVQQQNSENNKEPVTLPEDDTLNIFSAAAWHAFGENAEIVRQMLKFRSPDLDSTLLNHFGLPVLSYRIHAIDQLPEQDLSEKEPITKLGERRIQQLIQHQLEQHRESLCLIARQLKHSAIFYDHKLAYQYRIHPAWSQENYHEDENNNASMTAAVTRLNRLNIHVLLANRWVDDWNKSYEEQLLSQIEQKYSLIPAQIHIAWHFFPADIAYANWLELVQQSTAQSHEISLIIMADSEIDQEYLNDQVWQNEHYIAAEYAASWCLAAQELEIEGMIPLRILQIGKHVHHLQEYLAQQQPNLSAQLEQTEPFLVLLDEATHAQKIKKVQKKFANIDFEPEHSLHPVSYCGHSQHLATVFAAMLSAHLTNNAITIAYSLQQEFTYLSFINTENGQLDECALVA